eukprot:gene17837-biopygen15266
MSGVQQRELFIWKAEHDLCFVKELLLVEPYMHKPQSKERGQAWKLIVENLNKLTNPAFRVAVRAVRDRFSKLMEKFKKIEKEEERASGIQGADFDELYRGLSDINDRIEDAKLVWEEASDKDREKENNEKEKALDMRKKATESLSETKRRKQNEEGDETPKRKRKSSEAFAMIQEGMKIKREQAQTEAKLREEELQERQRARQHQQNMFQQQQEFMANMQMQQQQFMMQMQQQNTVILGQLLEVLKTAKDK